MNAKHFRLRTFLLVGTVLLVFSSCNMKISERHYAHLDKVRVDSIKITEKKTQDITVFKTKEIPQFNTNIEIEEQRNVNNTVTLTQTPDVLLKTTKNSINKIKSVDFPRTFIKTTAPVHRLQASASVQTGHASDSALHWLIVLGIVLLVILLVGRLLLPIIGILLALMTILLIVLVLALLLYSI